MGANPDDAKRSLEAVERDRAGDATADSYRQEPQSAEDDELAMSSATALSESESLADDEVELAPLSEEEAMALALEAQRWARDRRRRLSQGRRSGGMTRAGAQE